jgi:hypothetical protein
MDACGCRRERRRSFKKNSNGKTGNSKIAVEANQSRFEAAGFRTLHIPIDAMHDGIQDLIELIEGRGRTPTDTENSADKAELARLQALVETYRRILRRLRIDLESTENDYDKAAQYKAIGNQDGTISERSPTPPTVPNLTGPIPPSNNNMATALQQCEEQGHRLTTKRDRLQTFNDRGSAELKKVIVDNSRLRLENEEYRALLHLSDNGQAAKALWEHNLELQRINSALFQQVQDINVVQRDVSPNFMIQIPSSPQIMC